MTFIIEQKETFLNQVLKMGGNGAFLNLILRKKEPSPDWKGPKATGTK
jgi:hypothetical protein